MADRLKNKQRLPRVSRREKYAAVMGGVVDDRIPENLIMKRLANESNYKFNLEELLPIVRKCVAECRGFLVPDGGSLAPIKLERAEIMKQANVACADILELIERLDNLCPDLICWADEAQYLARKDPLLIVLERLKPDLYSVFAALKYASGVVSAYPRKTNSKGNMWIRARDGIAESLIALSIPAMAKKSAAALAVNLLELCDLKSPRKPRGK